MPSFSTIVQTPDIRAIVQDGALERAFHDALFPRLLFRGEAAPQIWPANVGDNMTFTGVGLVKKKLRPLQPGVDPNPSDYVKEQWSAQLQQYADSIDTPMPTSITAIANLFLRNAMQLGIGGAESLNDMVRDRLYNAALSGSTVADGAGSGTTLRVKRLNGFTKARRPDLANGSPVAFMPVSSANPLKIKLKDNGVDNVVNTVIGFTADNPGDEIGPGTLTLSVSMTSVADRAYVIADDRTNIVRVGGGNSIDSINSASLFKLADIRSAVARLKQQNVPEMPDGRYHCHMDTTSQTQIFSDTETQRMLTSLPDYFMYRDFAVGQLLGCVFFTNTKCPIPDTVITGNSDDGLTFSLDDPFAGEMWTTGATSGVKVHRPIFLGAEAIYEYYQEMNAMITEAGVTGRVGQPSITNNGIEIESDRIQLIIRAPLNRLQDTVSTSWKFIGDWPVRTDSVVGDGARYKRELVVEHGE